MLHEDKAKKEKVLVGFKKASSHIKKIIRMVENNKYCIDIIQQILAVQGLLRSCQAHILESHLKTCFQRGIKDKGKKKKEKLVKEILKATRLSNK